MPFREFLVFDFIYPCDARLSHFDCKDLLRKLMVALINLLFRWLSE